MSIPPDLEAFFVAEAARIRAELFDFLRIPSVSTDPERRADVQHAAEWLAGALRGAGLTVEIHPTAGHPIVLGEWRQAPGAPTVLVYGHYDVQPAEPRDLWTSPPFEPAVRDGRIYARGATDDKGQLFLHVKALEAHLRARGTLPVNVVLLAEGEEEIGSDHLLPFIESHADRLRCDAVVISDSAMYAPGVPALLSSLRGLAYFQIDVQGPSVDLHSGTYGGAVVNPATALARILATFHDADGRVAIPGFYDQVREWPPELRRQIAELPFDENDLRAETGAPALGGEAGYTPLERLWIRPTCEVHGLLSGYTGEGGKTIIPAHAMAKVSCRLVADQDPAEIDRLLRAHIERVAPKGVHVKVTLFSGGPAWQGNLSGPFVDAARRAFAAAFGWEPVIIGDGGSIPVVGDFQRILGAPVLLMGFGLPGENAHAPNEWLSEGNFEGGMRTAAVLWEEIGKHATVVLS
jgi:acetylornithine deacetylase/succinyl-diaminopimelate desuccinylase-like protein